MNEFDHPDHGWKWRDCEVRWIEAKIAEAIAAEREACAKLCETEATEAFGEDAEDWARGAVMCAVRIRERFNDQGKPTPD